MLVVNNYMYIYITVLSTIDTKSEFVFAMVTDNVSSLFVIVTVTSWR